MAKPLGSGDLNKVVSKHVLNFRYVVSKEGWESAFSTFFFLLYTVIVSKETETYQHGRDFYKDTKP